MNTIDRVLYSLGFIDCMAMFAQASGHDAQLKKAYVTERIMKIILDGTQEPQIREKIKFMIDDVLTAKFYNEIVKIMQEKVDADNMKKLLKGSDLFKFE